MGAGAKFERNRYSPAKESITDMQRAHWHLRSLQSATVRQATRASAPASLEAHARQPSAVSYPDDLLSADSEPSYLGSNACNAEPVIRRNARRGRFWSRIATSKVDTPRVG